VACSLQPDDLHGRTAHWQHVLTGGERRTIKGGIAVSVPAARSGELAALCASEQECCPFFDFTLHLDGAQVHLEVRSPDEAHELIAQLMA
jgi:hypothetical protein